MVYMQMCREELFDMPVFGTGEMLYFFTFAAGITSESITTVLPLVSSVRK